MVEPEVATFTCGEKDAIILMILPHLSIGCSSCIIYMPLFALLFINTIVTCSFYPHHQHHYELCFHCFCSESRATVSTPATVFPSLTHCVPVCFNSVYFCVTVFQICVFFLTLFLRSVYLLCYCVLDLFYYTTVSQIWCILLPLFFRSDFNREHFHK